MEGVSNYSNSSVKEIVTNSSDTSLLLVSRIISIFILLGILIYIIRFIKTSRLEKRFNKYTIKSKKSKEKSLTIILHDIYINIVKMITNSIKDLKFIQKISNRYKRYAEIFDEDNNEINIISKKIFIGILYLIVVVILRLKNGLTKPYEMILPFIIGYYSLDLVYMYKYSRLKKQIENDMLQAITIMKNAFKSGRSIIQAIDMVASDIKGPISTEFKRISLEIKYGLDIEVAFKRFADRVDLDEAIYLTSSLTVLNKTGGNIIEVFDTIEETLMNRKKLRNELNSLTGSSKLIMWVLIVVPVVFVILIGFINSGYFNPLFTNALGIILLIIMITIYMLYIYIVRKIMKVRM